MNHDLYTRTRRLAGRAKRLVIPPYRTPVNRFTYADPLDLKEISRETLLKGTRTGAWFENGTETRHFERIRPGFVDDPDGVNLFSEGELRSTYIGYPPALAVSGRDVTLIGYREFLTRERRFFTDDALLSDRRMPWLNSMTSFSPGLNEETGFRPAGYRDTFRLRRDVFDAQHIPGRTVALVSQEPYIYGSWLFRIVAKMTTLERLGLMDEKVLVHMPFPTYRESLELAGLKAEQLIQHDYRKMYRLDHAIVPGHRNGHALLDSESKAVFAKMRDKVGHDADRKRIYVARNKPGQANAWNGRVMINEAELIDRLIPLGFEIVVPGTLNFQEQVRTFASAGFVLGASGSAMFNAVFCLPGTKLIDIESEPHWINAHMCLFSSLGLDYGVFVGKVDQTDPAEVHRRWRVNVDALIERVASFMK